MNPPKSLDDHTFAASWSDEDQEYVGRCAQFPSLSWLAPSQEDALAGIRRLVQDCLGDMSAAGQTDLSTNLRLLKAISAHYDVKRHHLVVTLNNGQKLLLNPDSVQGLRDAKTSALIAIELTPSGLGLHFPLLDADVYVPALLAGQFGTSEWIKNLEEKSSKNDLQGEI